MSRTLRILPPWTRIFGFPVSPYTAGGDLTLRVVGLALTSPMGWAGERIPADQEGSDISKKRYMGIYNLLLV